MYRSGNFSTPPDLFFDQNIPPLEDVIGLCLRKDLDRRFQHMADVKLLLGAPDQEGPGSLGYFIYFGADHALGPASVIRVEFDPRAGVVKDAHLDTETGQGGAD